MATLLGRWHPIGPRIVGIVVFLSLLVVCTVTWFAIGAEVRSHFSLFQRITLVLIGVAIFVILWALGRSSVEAWSDKVVVVNGFKRREFAWAQIVSINMPAGAPWVTLDLADGSTVSAMGIQGSDGAQARNAVRSMRSLLAENS